MSTNTNGGEQRTARTEHDVTVVGHNSGGAVEYEFAAAGQLVAGPAFDERDGSDSIRNAAFATGLVHNGVDSYRLTTAGAADPADCIAHLRFMPDGGDVSQVAMYVDGSPVAPVDRPHTIAFDATGEGFTDEPGKFQYECTFADGVTAGFTAEGGATVDHDGDRLTTLPDGRVKASGGARSGIDMLRYGNGERGEGAALRGLAEIVVPERVGVCRINGTAIDLDDLDRRLRGGDPSDSQAILQEVFGDDVDPAALRDQLDRKVTITPKEAIRVLVSGDGQAERE